MEQWNRGTVGQWNNSAPSNLTGFITTDTLYVSSRYDAKTSPNPHHSQPHYFDEPFVGINQISVNGPPEGGFFNAH